MPAVQPAHLPLGRSLNLDVTAYMKTRLAF